VFKSERYPITARTADNAWLQLAHPKAEPGKGTWILNALGAVEGDLSQAPVTTAKIKPRTGRVKVPPKLKGVPVLSARAKQLYAQSAAKGRDPRMFTVIGDCNSQPTAYIGRLAAGLYDLSQYEYYQATVSRFANAFPRISLAASGGVNTAAVLDPLWSDHYFCRADETPLACELRVSNASIVFLELGTGDTHAWQEFEDNYRQIVGYAVSQGVLPVLITKADNLESTEDTAPEGHINAAIRKIGTEFEVPVMDFWLISRELANFGLIDEGNSDFHLSEWGSDVHLLMTLQTLEAVWRK